MGYKLVALKAPTSYTDDWLRNAISHNLGIREFSFVIENKSLDARNKNNIHWLLSMAVFSDEIKGGQAPAIEILQIPSRKRLIVFVVLGCG